MKKGLFVGIPIPTSQATEYSELFQQLWSDHQYIQWFKPETLHCTLAYVNINKSSRPIPYIADALRDAAKNAIRKHTRLVITLNRFEWFGPNKEILVATDSPRNTDNKLSQLARTLQRKIRNQRLAVVQNQPFRAHVSLGRQHTENCTIHSSPLNPYPSCEPPLRLNVDHISVYESLNGHRYRIWHTIYLSAKKDEEKSKRV